MRLGARTAVAALAAVAVALGSGGCAATGAVGSGNLDSRDVAVGGFDAIEAGSAFNVRLRVGSDYDVVVRADDNLIDRVRSEVSGGTLRLGFDGPVLRVTLEAEVTVPDQALQELRAGGAATIAGGDRLQAESLRIEADGASTVRLDLDVQQLDVEADGASTIEVRGSADSLLGRASGASRLRLFDLSATTAEVEADGASSAEVTVSEELDARASGASTIRYDGNPAQVSRDTSGASSIDAR